MKVQIIKKSLNSSPFSYLWNIVSDHASTAMSCVAVRKKQIKNVIVNKRTFGGPFESSSVPNQLSTFNEISKSRVPEHNILD